MKKFVMLSFFTFILACSHSAVYGRSSIEPYQEKEYEQHLKKPEYKKDTNHKNECDTRKPEKCDKTQRCPRPVSRGDMEVVDNPC